MNDYANIYVLLLFIFIKTCIILYLYSNIIFFSSQYEFTRGIDNFFVDSNMSSFHLYLTKYLMDLLNVQLNPLETRVANMKKGFDDKQSKLKSEKNKSDGDAIAYNSQLQKETMDKTLELKRTIQKIIDYQTQNMTAIKSTYDLFFKRLKTYVNNMLNTLKTLQFQYNLASITPDMTAAIVPIKTAYDSIYNLLTQHGNKVFINKYFNIQEIPIFQPKSPTSMRANFESSTKAFQTLM
jgi:hypothetical protein